MSVEKIHATIILQIALFLDFTIPCEIYGSKSENTADCFGYGWAVDNYKVFAINAVIYQIGEPAKMKMVLKKC